ncbi:MAG: hypothetical protein EXR98_21270 [Gemmataceae bacterium]|nr:hypothetical protein [Gemmataceae bacterium]
MASPTQTNSPADWADLLPEVQLEVRTSGTRPATYALGDVDFLIGGVPGCDLRVGAETPTVLCLLARHPAGVTLRKLAPTQSIFVNGQGVSQRELADGDRVQIGIVEIHVRISPARVTAKLDEAKKEFATQVHQFREQLVAQGTRSQPQLEERAMEVTRQQEELVKLRQEMTDLRKQLYDHYQDRRDKLAALQDDLEKARLALDEREKKLRLDEEDANDRRQRDRKRQEEIERQTVELTQRSLRFEEARGQIEQRHKTVLDDWSCKNADLQDREKTVAEKARDLDVKQKTYDADVLRLHRLEGTLDQREAELQTQTAEQTKQRDQLQHDTGELESQLLQLDEWRVKLRDEADRLALQKQQQADLDRQLAERGASLEGQQATFTVLRGRLERMREDIQAREQRLDEQRVRQDARQIELTAREQEIDKVRGELETEEQQYASDRQQWLERGAVMDAAVRQLKQAQEKLVADEERLRRERQELEERGRQLADSDGVMQGKLAQVGEAQARLDLERHTLRERGVHLIQREETCNALQEQLHRRSEEIAARHKEITERLQEYQAKFAELEERRQQVEQRDQELKQQVETWRADLESKAELLRQKHAEVTGFDDHHQDQLTILAIQRKTHADERAQFQLDQQAAVEKLVQARVELETLRQDARTFIEELPDAELRAGAAVERLGDARAQLRNHLGEVHEYVRQCQAELEQLRGRLQGDLDKLVGEEQSLRKSQDEHRLAMAGFRQQLIDWQGQITELKRLLARDSTRIERREAQVEEQTKQVEAESQRLAQQAEQLDEQERDVADRREDLDRHLVDMRQWYRHKLRELAGIPLLPGASAVEVQGQPSLGLPTDEDGIVPISRDILSITAAADAGDRKLGQLLRESQLIDADTLTALLAESRRQRRSLRQVLLASGVITLYQLALIEAGNVQGLMLGPVRILDRLRHTLHEAVYRVFDPRRGTEAVLRHLAEADMSDAVKPDEFRQCFKHAMLNDPHLANTLEVLELSGRPAAVQEWLAGLPATDWPPLAAAPGVCYRLLTQAAQGLATAHQAGVVHGHLADTMFLLTGDGVLKIRGLGEPPWLSGIQHDEEPTTRDDLRALGKIVSGWCSAPSVRKGAKTKPLPDALVSVLYRLAADGEPGYRDVKELVEDLQKAADAIPPNAEAWDRLVKYVREHGAAEAMLRQSA